MLSQLSAVSFVRVWLQKIRLLFNFFLLAFQSFSDFILEPIFILIKVNFLNFFEKFNDFRLIQVLWCCLVSVTCDSVLHPSFQCISFIFAFSFWFCVFLILIWYRFALRKLNDVVLVLAILGDDIKERETIMVNLVFTVQLFVVFVEVVLILAVVLEHLDLFLVLVELIS